MRLESKDKGWMKKEGGGEEEEGWEGKGKGEGGDD